jgi:hypothetical protein
MLPTAGSKQPALAVLGDAGRGAVGVQRQLFGHCRTLDCEWGSSWLLDAGRNHGRGFHFELARNIAARFAALNINNSCAVGDPLARGKKGLSRRLRSASSATIR